MVDRVICSAAATRNLLIRQLADSCNSIVILERKRVLEGQRYLGMVDGQP